MQILLERLLKFRRILIAFSGGSLSGVSPKLLSSSGFSGGSPSGIPYFISLPPCIPKEMHLTEALSVSSLVSEEPMKIQSSLNVFSSARAVIPGLSTVPAASDSLSAKMAVGRISCADSAKADTIVSVFLKFFRFISLHSFQIFPFR